jgi:hypothetical protein
MTHEQLAAMHRLLAEYHRKRAKEAALDVVQLYHALMNANNKKKMASARLEP